MTVKQEAVLAKFLNKRCYVKDITDLFGDLYVAVKDYTGVTAVPVEFIEPDSKGLNTWFETMGKQMFKVVVLRNGQVYKEL